MQIGAVLSLVLLAAPQVAAAQEMSADEIQKLKQENILLKKRVTTLEATVRDIQKKLQGGARPRTSAGEKPARMADRSNVSVVDDPKVAVDLYGYIKLDVAYDSSRTSTGNYARWVESEATNEDDDQFNMTARQSRLGVKIDTKEIAGVKGSGRVEVDFYEGGSENKNTLMLRHAVVKLDWPRSNFNILAGQTSDVISPLVPFTLNYPVAWWSGNIGYRRPQVRLTKRFAYDNGSKFKIEGALARTIGDDWGFDPGDTGEDSGFPTLQGRAALTLPQGAVLGLSGHWGEEEYDSANTGSGHDFDTWSANIDLALPVNDALTLKGEVFTGKNLDAYLGGIAQGVNRTLLSEIESTGGWLALGIKASDKWSFNFGGGMDNPDNADLNAGDRTRNASYWGNVVYDINEFAQVGVELSSWRTKYKGQKDGDSLRAQSSLTYKF